MRRLDCQMKDVSWLYERAIISMWLFMCLIIEKGVGEDESKRKKKRKEKKRSLVESGR